MSDFPEKLPAIELEEDVSVHILMMHGSEDDTVDANVAGDDADRDDYCHLIPSQRRRTLTGGDILTSLSPPHPVIATGGDVLNHFNPRNETPSTSGPQDVVDALGDQDQDEDVSDLPPPPISDDPTEHLKIVLKQFPVIDEDFSYKMDKPQRGCFVIFNQRMFDLFNSIYCRSKPEDEHMKFRHGTDRDAANLKIAAEALGFEYVKIINDSTRSEILSWISRMATADHSNYDCFACAILTHGGDDDVLYARDEQMKLTDFTRPFGADRCESLAGKPKLFFIQACRGFKLDHGKTLPPAPASDTVDGPIHSPPQPTENNDMYLKEISIPAEADFLIANSTVPDYYAWRNNEDGSWFIRALCAVFIECGHKWPLMRMMTRVNNLVAYNFASSSTDAKMNAKKQIPSIATRLTAELSFKPKKTFTQQSGDNSMKIHSSSLSSSYVYQRRIARGSHGEVSSEERVMMSSSLTSPSSRMRYPSGDRGSPRSVSSDKFASSSPRSSSRPRSGAFTPTHTPNRASPVTFAFPTSQIPRFNQERKTSCPIVTPKLAHPRKTSLSPEMNYSQSWGTQQGGSEMRSNCSTPRSGSPVPPHSSSLPGSRRSSTTGSKKKDFKQTHL